MWKTLWHTGRWKVNSTKRNAVAQCKVVRSEGIIFAFLQLCNECFAAMQAKFGCLGSCVWKIKS